MLIYPSFDRSDVMRILLKGESPVQRSIEGRESVAPDVTVVMILFSSVLTC
jgi:hypothetical protein